MLNRRTLRSIGRWAAVPAIFLAISFASSAEEQAAPRYGERWVYCSANLQVDKSADDVIELIERAGRYGYTALFFADYKLQILDRVTDFYFRNAERVKAAAARAGIELIPAVCSVGYSNGTWRMTRTWPRGCRSSTNRSSPVIASRPRR